MSKVVYQGGLFSGAILDENGKPVCEHCKDKTASAQRGAHIDFTDRYTNCYECSCGNSIAVTRKRKGFFTEKDLEEDA